MEGSNGGRMGGSNGGRMEGSKGGSKGGRKIFYPSFTLEYFHTRITRQSPSDLHPFHPL
ncbi:hypothetical protein ES703_104667 [subsurface metagenome]